MNSTHRPVPLEPSAVTLSSLELELGAQYAALAVVLDDCFKPGAGAAMLGATAEQVMDYYKLVGVRQTVLGAQLPAWFAYAYQGRVSLGLSVNALSMVDGPFERLKDFLGLLNVNNGYFQDCFETSGTYDAVEHGHLSDLVNRVEARMALDRHESLDLSQVALLANMSERSVRNAVTAEGTGKLDVDHTGRVSPTEAARWLAGRRGFIPTTAEQQSSAEQPETLSIYEIPHFLEAELYKKWRDVPGASSTWLADAAKAAGLSPARLEEVCQLPTSVLPHEAAGLAKALGLDPVWLTKQVMWALYPDQMDMVMNPANWKEPEGGHGGEAHALSVSVVLTEAMLKNGYLAIPASAKSLFPEDCLSERPKNEDSATVELRFGNHIVESNIRWQSSKTLSPRTRFGSWFNTELRAKVGDTIKLDKVAERSFVLTHVPQSFGG